MGVYRTLSKEESDNIAARILYEDNHILVFNKLAGEIVQGDKTGDEPLSEKLKAFVAQRDSKPGQVFMGVPHRLDRPVSGIAMFAKTSKALERLDAMFKAGEVDKRYWALVCSKPEKEQAVLENYLSRNEKQNRTFVCKGGKMPENAKFAKLEYTFLWSSQRYHLLEVKLYTGRHHQIRAQLSSVGCVIKGDLKYGAPRSNNDGSICLHARSISFVHPVRKEPLYVEAPVIQATFWQCIKGMEQQSEK